MGLFGNLLGGLLGAGAGVAGAHNAHLAELAIKTLSQDDKMRVAQKVIEMGVNATGGRMSSGQFCDHFNRKDRLCQLNVIALALAEMNIHVIRSDSWMEVKNPFMLNIDAKDLEVNSVYLFKKHNLKVSVGSETINIRDWLS